MKNQKTKKGKEDEEVLRGIISVTSRHHTGYLQHKNFKEDIEIPFEELNTALHGDTVDIALLPRRNGRRQQGKVVEVIVRAKIRFIGVLKEENGRIVLIPDDKKMYVPLSLPRDTKLLLSAGKKAAVELTHWSDPREKPEGILLKILGDPGSHEVEMEAIVLGKGFDISFPEDVRKEAEAIGKEASGFQAKEIPLRRDFRTTPTFTIDPDDAKDFDDAISFREISKGEYEIGIHIADVSAYMREGTTLDKEARRRGTSVYLVDRTIPMLPEVLSNDLCSLNENEDKLTFSAVFTMRSDGSVLTRWFGETVIRSQKRFTYAGAQQVLQSGEGVLARELSIINDIAKKLKQKRFESGAISFDQDEIKFRLDLNGKPIEVYRKERSDTNYLIEEFMLLANREVAQHVYNLSHKTSDKNAVFLYRVHDFPDPDKIDDLAIFIRAIGYELNQKGNTVTAKELNALFKQIEGKPEEHLIKIATIRSMAKAIYSTKNIGHFGLAFKFYTHFTSPIRRYPDVLVHRILKRHLTGSPIPLQEFGKYERLAIEASEREVAAVEAERDSVRYKQVEYMTEHIGEEFEGIVSGVKEWGIFVEEEKTRAEGLIRLESLTDDEYTPESPYAVVGRRKKKRFALADRVRVKLMKADLETRTIDWAFVK